MGDSPAPSCPIHRSWAWSWSSRAGRTGKPSISQEGQEGQGVLPPQAEVLTPRTSRKSTASGDLQAPGWRHRGGWVAEVATVTSPRGSETGVVFPRQPSKGPQPLCLPLPRAPGFIPHIRPLCTGCSCILDFAVLALEWSHPETHRCL